MAWIHSRDEGKNWKKRKFYIIIFVFLIALDALIVYILIQSNPPDVPSNSIVWVAGDGSGNFTCDGIDDQVEINQALAYVAENPQLTTVYLKGPNTYVLSDTVFVGNETILEGDPAAVIKLIDHADWPVFKPMIIR